MNWKKKKMKNQFLKKINTSGKKHKNTDSESED